MIEALGILASVIILISFLFKNEKNIRLINILGAICFVAYGLLLGAFSVWFLNGALIAIHIYYLTRK